MGLQFIPRIGQEVLVDFIEGDIDRPVVICALHNGKGEAGIPASRRRQGAGVLLPISRRCSRARMLHRAVKAI